MHRDGAVCLILLYDRNLSIKNSIKIHVSLPVSFNCKIKSRVVARNRLYSLATIVELSSSSMFVHSFLEHYNLLDSGSNLHDRPLARLLKSKAVSLAILTNIPVNVLYNFYFDNYAEESNYTCIITFGTTFLLIIRLSILPSPARIVCRTWNVQYIHLSLMRAQSRRTMAERGVVGYNSLDTARHG